MCVSLPRYDFPLHMYDASGKLDLFDRDLRIGSVQGYTSRDIMPPIGTVDGWPVSIERRKRSILQRLEYTARYFDNLVLGWGRLVPCGMPAAS